MTTAPEQAAAKGWMPDDSTFGARLALIRQRMGWGNVREAAAACGVPSESWRTWERDGVVPRRLVEMSTLIARATGCDLGWLIAGRQLQQDAPSQPPPAHLGQARAARRARSRFKDLYIPVGQTDEPEELPKPVNPPTGPRRHDPRRPMSAIPSRTRRPQPVRPGVRPMPR